MQKNEKKRQRLLALPLFFLFLFSACTPSADMGDAYLRTGHRVEAVWEIGGQRYEGIIAVSEGLSRKDGKILYTAPRALAGIEVLRTGDTVRLSLGDAALTTDAEAAAAALDFFWAGSGVTVTSENGKTVLRRGEDALTVLREVVP